MTLLRRLNFFFEFLKIKNSCVSLTFKPKVETDLFQDIQKSWRPTYFKKFLKRRRPTYFKTYFIENIHRRALTRTSCCKRTAK